MQASEKLRTHKDEEGGEQKGEMILFQQRVLDPRASLQSLEDRES